MSYTFNYPRGGGVTVLYTVGPALSMHSCLGHLEVVLDGGQLEVVLDGGVLLLFSWIYVVQVHLASSPRV